MNLYLHMIIAAISAKIIADSTGQPELGLLFYGIYPLVLIGFKKVKAERKKA